MEHDPIIRTLMDRMKDIHHLNIVLMRRNRKVAQLRDAHIRRDRAALLHASALESIRRSMLAASSNPYPGQACAMLSENLAKVIEEINTEANRDVRGNIRRFRR